MLIVDNSSHHNLRGMPTFGASGGKGGGPLENGRLSDVKTLEVRHQNTTQRFIML